jgi:hypothetical protein
MSISLKNYKENRMTPLQMGLAAIGALVAVYALYTMMTSSEERMTRQSTIHNYAAFAPYLLLVGGLIVFYMS